VSDLLKALQNREKLICQLNYNLTDKYINFVETLGDFFIKVITFLLIIISFNTFVRLAK